MPSSLQLIIKCHVREPSHNNLRMSLCTPFTDSGANGIWMIGSFLDFIQFEDIHD